MSNKKLIILVVLLLVASIGTLLGTTYALFTKTLWADKKVSVQAGTLKVDFKEGNIINLDNIAPMSDIKGQKTTPYTFSVENKGTIKAYYTVSFEEDGNNTLDTQFVKYRLTNDKGFDSGVVTVKDKGNGTFMVKDDEEIAVGERVNYTLCMWLSDTADNSAQGKIYKNKIIVNSKSNEGRKAIPVAEVLLADSANNINKTDPKQTFITGESPNNYIWYSGKLWRAVSIDPADNSVKLVTQWGISSATYNEVKFTESSGYAESSAFRGSHMEMWLNDTTVDGFLGNLREPENFIKMDSRWNATTDTRELGSFTRPDDESGTIALDAVGLLNVYEYQMSYSGTTPEKGYLNNGTIWWTLTPKDDMNIIVENLGAMFDYYIGNTSIIRPSINLKSSVQIMEGNGTEKDPYRLVGDNDTSSNGVLLSTRYSGEYIRFGTGENNLYRIVSKENGTGVKITSERPLSQNGNFIEKGYNITDENYTYNAEDSSYEVAYFLNHDYLDPANGYLTSEQVNMIEDNSKWYIGEIYYDGGHYRLAKYTDVNMGSLTSSTNAKVGILRVGELMTGLFDRIDSDYSNDIYYWLLTLSILDDNSSVPMQFVGSSGDMGANSSDPIQIRPALHLKPGVRITGGNGTKEAPFEIRL